MSKWHYLHQIASLEIPRLLTLRNAIQFFADKNLVFLIRLDHAGGTLMICYYLKQFETSFFTAEVAEDASFHWPTDHYVPQN